MNIDLQNPPKRYGVIYADPPWAFLTRSAKGKDRSAEKHYDCMSIKDICALPLPAADDCALLMWVTDPFLEIGFDVLKAWGFKYSTVGFTWAKLKRSYRPDMVSTIRQNDWHVGMGYTTRANAEMCLLAKRGTPERLNKDVRRLVVSPVREHSRKPDRMYNDIERLYPGPYLEMFGRTTREGWDTFGNQSDKFLPSDVIPVDDSQKSMTLLTSQTA